MMNNKYLKPLAMLLEPLAILLTVVGLTALSPGSSVGSSGVNAGTIIAFAGATCPSGYVSANGASLLRAGRYANLFAAISTGWGTADGTHFNVPDLRGRFLRGRDNGAGNDPDASSRTASATGGNTGDAVGSLESGQNLAHSHGVTDPGHSHNAGALSNQTFIGSGGNALVYTGAYNTSPVSFSSTGITINSSGGSEARPANITVQYCIAY